MDLAYAFIELLNTKKVKDITISDICQKGNYSRETFYYHFKNKDDLIAWMHYFEKESYFNRYFGREDFVSIVERIIKDMMKIEDFYIRSFEDSISTKIEEIMMRQTIEIYTKMAKLALGNNVLSTEMELSIYYSVYGSVILIRDWILTENDISEHELASFITESLNDNLKELFLNYKRPLVS